MRTLTTVLLATTLLAGQQKAFITDYVASSIGPVPTELNLDPFYKRYITAQGIPVVSSEKPPEIALLVARDIVVHMLSKRPDVREAMIAKKYRVVVMAQTEMTTDLPEQRNWKKPPPPANMPENRRAAYEKMTDKEYWDNRARGMGGNPTSGTEENLLGYPGTKYYGENIFMHEFSHAILGGGVRTADPKLYDEVKEAYAAAMAAGLWKGHYAASNVQEYWAEATQTWFWSNYGFHDGDKYIISPDDLKQYDPRIYELLGRVYPDHHVPMDVYHAKDIHPANGRIPGNPPGK